MSDAQLKEIVEVHKKSFADQQKNLQPFLAQPFGGDPLTPAEVAVLEARAAKEGWIHRDLVSLDQFANVVFLHGLPDETMSSHFQRLADSGNWFGKAMCAWLDVIQKRHGQKAQAGDLQRAEKVEETEMQYLHPMSDAIESSTDVLTGEGEKK